MRPTFAVCLALGLALLCGCSRRSSESSVTTAETDTTGTAIRTQSEADIRQHLAATRAHIDSLREEAAHVGSKVDAAVATQLAQVEAERDTAAQQLARLQQATREEWKNLQSGLATMLDTLDARVDTLRVRVNRRIH
jgi:uncharacterized protein with NAD-binding domain and iron-sulfur cluster